MDQSNLTFATLREANLRRLPLFKNGKGEPAHSEPDGSDWSISEWLEALTGELGEFANWHKKFRRGDIDRDEMRAVGRAELADIQIYLDLLAYRFEQEMSEIDVWPEAETIDLAQMTADKFNAVSQRVGAPVFIWPRGVGSMDPSND